MIVTLVPVLAVALLAALLILWRSHVELRRQTTHLKLRRDGWHRLTWNDLREAWSCPHCGATMHGNWAVIQHREDSHCTWFGKHRAVFDSIRASYEATGWGAPVTAVQVPDVHQIDTEE